MTNEQAKQKAIQEAYGQHWEKAKPDAYGWSLSNNMKPVEFGTTVDIEEIGYISVRWRPISLRGIEDNNGWHRIETVDDLPKEPGYYRVMVKHAKPYMQKIEYFIYETEEYKVERRMQTNEWIKYYSHWIPAPPPIPDPLY